ncbi:MAG: hypothetical protein ATN35_00760 [Epulopiscium sp. Nele67-Bin004]|nr:MAG: hypothetical protein ATN35_00760 [Epulopiscium sp. Nele67-Bin004]
MHKIFLFGALLGTALFASVGGSSHSGSISGGISSSSLYSFEDSKRVVMIDENNATINVGYNITTSKSVNTANIQVFYDWVPIEFRIDDSHIFDTKHEVEMPSGVMTDFDIHLNLFDMEFDNLEHHLLILIDGESAISWAQSCYVVHTQDYIADSYAYSKNLTVQDKSLFSNEPTLVSKKAHTTPEPEVTLAIPIYFPNDHLIAVYLDDEHYMNFYIPAQSLSLYDEDYYAEIEMPLPDTKGDYKFSSILIEEPFDIDSYFWYESDEFTITYQ